MRKISMLIVLLTVLDTGPVSKAWTDQTAILRQNHFTNDVKDFEKNTTKKRWFEEQSLYIQAGALDSIDTLTWRNPYTYQPVNLGFLNHGDSMLVWLDPPAACSLIAIRFRPIDFEGTLILDIWDASNYDQMTYSSDSTDENGWWGTFDPIDCGSCWVSGLSTHSPLGWRKNDPEHHYWGPVGVKVTEDNVGKWIEIPSFVAPQGKIHLDRDPFYIGATFYISSGWGFYAQYDWTTPYNFFKFYSSCCGPDDTHDGWFLRKYFMWFEAIVQYHENIPPTITELKVQNYTYGRGPFEITVMIEDDDFDDPSMPGVALAELVYSINGCINSVPMVGPPKGGEFKAHISELAVGDEVTYWVEATDPVGLSSQSDTITFARIEPEHPGADILVIWDDRFDEDLDTLFVDLFSSLDTHYEFELWNNPKRHGIDASVINWGWNTIYISGWGCKNTLPGKDYVGNPFVEWFEAGTVDKPHNLLYNDQDYFCVHDEYDCYWVERLTEGEFMYDYFGVVLPTSDPFENYDSVAIGEGDFEGIRVNFLPDALHPSNPENWLWPDMLVELTNDAEQIFMYKDTELGAGVRLDRGHYKTVYLPWPDFFAVDSSENGDLVPREGLTQAIVKILEWFGTKTDVQHTVSEPSIPDQFRLFQNYPNPFNSTTGIRYQIADIGSSIHTTLKIYNILGHEVRTLVNEYKEPGNYIVRWNGRDNFKNEASSGLYFYQLKTNNFVSTKSMLLLK